MVCGYATVSCTMEQGCVFIIELSCFLCHTIQVLQISAFAYGRLHVSGMCSAAAATYRMARVGGPAMSE